MSAKYDPNQPIDTLFKQIEAAVEFAATGNAPFTAQVVNKAFLLIFATGAYEDECKIWKRKTLATQTWNAFKIDFMRAHKNRRELQKLQQQGSPAHLFGANIMDDTSHQGTASLTEPSTITNSSYSSTSDKIDAIANATLESGQQILLLANENEELKSQVSQMQKILEKMQTKLDEKDNSSQSFTNTSRYKGYRKKNRKPRGYDANSKHYCWSHGLTQTPFHTSKNCRDPEPGIKKEATISNRLKGSSYRCHLANNLTQEQNNNEDN